MRFLLIFIWIPQWPTSWIPFIFFWCFLGWGGAGGGIKDKNIPSGGKRFPSYETFQGFYITFRYEPVWKKFGFSVSEMQFGKCSQAWNS